MWEMDLGFVTHARGCETKCLYCPAEILTPIFAMERQSFADSRLVDLNDLDSGFF